MENYYIGEDKISFKEFNQEAYDAFIESDICRYVQQVIHHFRNWNRDTTKEEQLVKKVLANTETYDSIAFAYATGDSHQTIQSAIGSLASAVLKGNKDLQDVVDAHQVMSELILFASNMFPDYENNMYEAYNTINGYLKVQPLYRLKETVKEYYPLPNLESTTKHRPLGAYKWDITETTSLDRLNNTAFTILDIEEEEPSKDLEEKHSKWEIRNATRDALVNKPIYFNWHPDYRGRKYSAGYHWNPQGDEYEKSVIAFAESEKVTYKGIFSIIRAIARAFGKDKLIDSEKAKWYSENKDTLDWKLAKEPHIARVQMLSLHLAQSTGYTNIPVEHDATCSQKQIVAVLTKCKTTAMTCNIYNPDNTHIQDAYGLVATEMTRLLDMATQGGE